MARQMETVPTDKDTRRHFVKKIAVVGSVSGFMGFAGCSSGNSENGGSSGGRNGTNGSRTQGSATSLGSGSNSLAMSVTQEFGTIDPAKGTNLTQQLAITNTYDPLVFPKTKTGVKPHLATDWSISNDKKTYTFTLRDNVTFHNSGNTLTAEDVKFSMNRVLDINQGFASTFSPVLDKNSINIKDGKNIEFKLKKRFSPFLSALTLFWIVDKEAIKNNLKKGDYDENKDYGQDFLNNNDAGTGAYILKEIERGSHITLSQYDDYWMKTPNNRFETVRADIITKNATVRTLMKNGKLQMTSPFENTKTFENIDKYKNSYVQSAKSPTVFSFKLNTQRPPVDDVEVRRALTLGFDNKTALEQIAPISEPIHGPIPSFLEAHNNNIPHPRYNIKKAKQILNNAGYSKGDIKITTATTKNNQQAENMGLLFQSNMQDIGVNVEIKPTTFGTLTELASSPKKTPHATTIFFSPLYPSPDAFLYPQFSSKAANSWLSMEHLNDQKVDSLIEKSRSTLNDQERDDLYKEIQAAVTKLYPDIWIFAQNIQHGFANFVEHDSFPFPPSYYYWFHNYYHK